MGLRSFTPEVPCPRHGSSAGRVDRSAPASTVPAQRRGVLPKAARLGSLSLVSRCPHALRGTMACTDCLKKSCTGSGPGYATPLEAFTKGPRETLLYLPAIVPDKSRCTRAAFTRVGVEFGSCGRVVLLADPCPCPCLALEAPCKSAAGARSRAEARCSPQAGPPAHPPPPAATFDRLPAFGACGQLTDQATHSGCCLPQARLPGHRGCGPSERHLPAGGGSGSRRGQGREGVAAAATRRRLRRRRRFAGARGSGPLTEWRSPVS